MLETSIAKVFPVRDYDLSATLASGQVFRWQRDGRSWTGIIGSRWVRLRADRTSIAAEVVEPVDDWNWLTTYLQIEVDIAEVLRSFPDDEPMRDAVAACHGLRLLHQDPWECLASFILSSTKQIVQIQQIISLLCHRFGEPVPAPPGSPAAHAFPSPARLARVSEADLRKCKMGFRAPHLLEAARTISSGLFDPGSLHGLPIETARSELMRLPGVGRKIADCVLLFACGFHSAFPVDVWVTKALRQLYFPGRRTHLRQLQRFAATHFGPNAGYAQQYLFHYMRKKSKRVPSDGAPLLNGGGEESRGHRSVPSFYPCPSPLRPIV